MRERWPDPPADAPLPSAAEPGWRRKPKPTLRRYTWSRSHHDLPGKDEWSLVADMAGSTRPLVEALVWRLENYASTNRPRGTVTGFPLRAIAATWRCDADELARVFAALEHPDVGWLEDDVIVTFWERNPDEEDPTGALRAQRSRARRKIKRAMLAKGAGPAEILAELELRGLGYPHVDGVTRDAVTVTARPDQTKAGRGEAGQNFGDGAGEAPLAIQGESGKSGDFGSPDAARVWLAFHGKRILAERLNEPPPKAQDRLERWLARLGDDAVVLAGIIDQVAATDLVVARFLTAITEAIDRERDRAKGPRLPFGPSLAADNGRRRSNG